MFTSCIFFFTSDSSPAKASSEPDDASPKDSSPAEGNAKAKAVKAPSDAIVELDQNTLKPSGTAGVKVR